MTERRDPSSVDLVQDASLDAAVHEGAAQGLPAPSGALLDPRILAAWREWLAALATDAEAAIAAAHVYGELGPEAREAWLDVLAEDAPKLQVPAVAIYAPLLSVESDAARRERIEVAMGEEGELAPRPAGGFALRGIAAGGDRVVALVTPLYLRFVRVLWCRYLPEDGIAWARHDPIVRAEEAPGPGMVLDGAQLEATPIKLVIEELCHAILAQQRKGAELPPSLQLCADLFDAHLEGDPLP
ncbi:hypothetical protein [Sorangium cellulosum]|uniref:Uncharacterized protein n=1 Tax=Sorangium cellulosum So0157-2 TaxID=1254432 RepID=S4Y2H0_SORCE|nr:hypothetical protein [Sorangium cellulosum]AGP39692.1 hypothetical protein SCE1572_37490 [Sorangium cellulosum So0157-2]